MRNLKVILPYKSENQILYVEVSYVNEGCTYFFNAQHLYLQLSPVERCYFDFLCERMDPFNRIGIIPTLRNEFVSHFKKLTDQKPPDSRSITSMEKKLRELNLLLKVKGQGSLHYVNPKYVCKENQNQRKKSLQKIAEHAMNGEIDLTAILDRPLSSIFPQIEQQLLHQHWEGSNSFN